MATDKAIITDTDPGDLFDLMDDAVLTVPVYFCDDHEQHYSIDWQRGMNQITVAFCKLMIPGAGRQ